VTRLKIVKSLTPVKQLTVRNFYYLIRNSHKEPNVQMINRNHMHNTLKVNEEYLPIFPELYHKVTLQFYVTAVIKRAEA
jgi:hypothetical protein